MGYTNAKFVPGHYLQGKGQFQQFERPHWAKFNGSWAPAPPNQTQGFVQQPNQPHPQAQPILGPGGLKRSPVQQGGILVGIQNPGQYPGAQQIGPGGGPQLPMPMPTEQTPNLVDMRKQLAMMNLIQMLARLGKHAVAHSGAGDGMRM